MKPKKPAAISNPAAFSGIVRCFARDCGVMDSVAAMVARSSASIFGIVTQESYPGRFSASVSMGR
jgi:hypothetical protein